LINIRVKFLKYLAVSNYKMTLICSPLTLKMTSVKKNIFRIKAFTIKKKKVNKKREHIIE
jgi:hypothetical protein